VFYATPQGVGDFTRFYLSAKPDVSKDFVVDDQVINEFRKYLSDQHIKYTEPEIQENLTWLKWQIKREVFTSVFGLYEGFKVALQDDPQLDKAIELIPQSKALYQNARKIVAERQAAQTSHP
jgi:carboxyl-terminal processing protease